MPPGSVLFGGTPLNARSGWVAPSFPRGFWWGTAASSTQAEGAAPRSNWAVWERSGKAPPSADGSGFAERYWEDFRILAELGLRHHRLSIEWARIEPEPQQRDPAAVEHYLRIFDAAEDAGIELWVCLNHFTLPQWFEELGGFCNPEARATHWIPHVEFIAETFGHRTFGWKPINEPMAYATGGFLFGTMPPGRQGFDSFAEATVGVFEAWRDAWKILSGSAPVATIHNLSPVLPIDDDSASRGAAQLIDSVLWRVPIRAHTEGIVVLPGRRAVSVDGLEGSADLFGFSYYSAMGVRGKGGLAGPLGAVSTYPPGAPAGPLGYHPWADGIEIVIDRLSSDLPGVPLLVSENGMGTTDDEERERFLVRSLDLLSEKIAAGANVKGYFHWTSVDNYEWLAGFDVPFGVITRDRQPKPSADILASVAGRTDADGGARATGE